MKKPFTLAHVRKINPGINVEDDPYCIGYWAAIAGAPKTACETAREKDGWKQAKADIAPGGVAYSADL